MPKPAASDYATRLARLQVLYGTLCKEWAHLYGRDLEHRILLTDLMDDPHLGHAMRERINRLLAEPKK